jgi:hypothetical protein
MSCRKTNTQDPPEKSDLWENEECKENQDSKLAGNTVTHRLQVKTAPRRAHLVMHSVREGKQEAKNCGEIVFLKEELL